MQAQSQSQAWQTDRSSTPLDHALRALITRLKPFGLTKAEVVMIINLGVGLSGPVEEGHEGEHGGEREEAEAMDVDGNGVWESEHAGGEEAVMESGQAGAEHGHDTEAEADIDTGADGAPNGVEGHEDGGELTEEDYGALALLDTVIEEREERLSNADVGKVLAIIRECLNQGSGMGHDLQ